MYIKDEIRELPVQISPQENNYKLFSVKIKLSESNLGCFCQSSQETLLHLFWECPITEAFWTSFQQFFVSVDLILSLTSFNSLCQCSGLKGEKSILLLNHCQYYLIDFTFTLASITLFDHPQ